VIRMPFSETCSVAEREPLLGRVVGEWTEERVLPTPSSTTRSASPSSTKHPNAQERGPIVETEPQGETGPLKASSREKAADINRDRMADVRRPCPNFYEMLLPHLTESSVSGTAPQAVNDRASATQGHA